MDASAINLTLIILLALFAFFQQDAPRSFAALVFSWLTLIHSGLFWESTGFLYYGSAAGVNFLVIFLLNGVYPLSRMVLWLQRVTFCMLLTNVVGYGLWYWYFEPTLYNWAFVVWYVAALVILLNRGPRDVGGFTMDRWRTCFNLFNYKSLAFMRRIEKEIRA